MAFVNVPKDLGKVKSKLAFNLTKRQLICFGTAAVIGIPVYIFTREGIGNTGAALLMIGLMLPPFFLAMYEKDGQPAEIVLRNYVRAHMYWPKTRPFRTENFYQVIDREGKAHAHHRKSAAQKPSGKRPVSRSETNGSNGKRAGRA